MSYAGKININSTDYPIASTLYGVCTTAGATAAKVVTCPDFDTLLVGVTIAVKFTYTNTAADPTLNVNGTGARPIYVSGTRAPGTTPLSSWTANSVANFTYDGNAWIMNDTIASAILDAVYPVGSIYMSVNSASPAVVLGGTWEQIQDRFLLAAGSSHAAGATGGAETVTLAETNLPSHRHYIPALGGVTGGGGSHSHGLNAASYQVGSGGGSRYFADNLGSAFEGIVTAVGDHSHSVTTYASDTGYTGSGTAVDKMPPYLAVYVWKRTA